MVNVSELVLRDLARAALQKQPHAVTTTEVADALARFWTGDMQHVRRVLRELEAQGLAVRTSAGRPPSPRGGRPADLWHATR